MNTEELMKLNSILKMLNTKSITKKEIYYFVQGLREEFVNKTTMKMIDEQTTINKWWKR